VGREYDQSVLAARDKLQGAFLHLCSLQKILQRAHLHFEETSKTGPLTGQPK
jgi:hypothetical protein